MRLRRPARRLGRPARACLVRGGGLEVLRWEDWGGGDGGGPAWPQPRTEAIYRPPGGTPVAAFVVVPGWGLEPGSDALLVVQGGEDPVDPPTCWLLGWGRSSGEGPPCRPARGTVAGEEGIVELSNGRSLLEPAPGGGALPAVRRLSCLISTPFEVQEGHLAIAVSLSENFLHVVSLRRQMHTEDPEGRTESDGARSVKIESTCIELQYGALAPSFSRNPTSPQDCPPSKPPAMYSVISMEFIGTPYGARDLLGNLWLSLLYAEEEIDFRVLHAKCVCVSMSGSTPHPTHGPWGLQNIHPTSSVLKVSESTRFPSSLTGGTGFPGSPHTLIFSSEGITLVGPQTPRQSSQSSPAGDESILTYAMQSVKYPGETLLAGHVTCVTETAPGVFIMGDSHGWFYIVDCSSSDAWVFTKVVAASGVGGEEISTAAQSLCQVSMSSHDESDGIIFACSSSGNSRVLTRRVHETQVDTAKPQISSDCWREGFEKWEHVGAPAFCSFAPVSASLLVQDFFGPGEHSLFLGCGVAQQSGTLQRVLAGCRVRNLATVAAPSPAGAPELLCLENTDGVSTHVFLSYDAEDVTEILRIENDSIIPCLVDGFDTGAATIAVGRPDGQNFLVQVVREGFRCCATENSEHLAPSMLLKSDSQNPISHAAFFRDLVVLARGTHVEAFQFHGPGDIGEAFTIVLPHEISALGVFKGTNAFSGADCVVTGLWESNIVTIYSCATREPLASTDRLPDGCQARSVQLSDEVLLVGSSTGEVFLFKLTDGCMHLESRVHVGSVALQLFSLSTCGEANDDTHRSLFFAKSDQSAILQVGSSGLQARRVHMEGGCLASICPIPMSGTDCGVLCAGSNATLSVSYIDLEETAQSDTLHLHETVLDMTFHPPSRCLALLTEDLEGENWLRLVDSGSVDVLCSVRMGHGHQTVCCRCVNLPCIVPPESPHQSVSYEDRTCIVLSSYINVPGKAGASDIDNFHGILSIYGLDERDGTFQLQLLGVHPLPSVCLTVEGVEGRSEVQDGPNLLLGGSDSVISMRVVLDDTGYKAEKMLENATDAVASMIPSVQSLINKLVVFAGISSDAPHQDSVGPSAEVQQLNLDVQIPWHQRATFSIVQSLRTPGRSSITSIVSAGQGRKLATEFMGACLLLEFSAEDPRLLQIMSSCKGGQQGMGHATAVADVGDGTFAIGASMPSQLLVYERNLDSEKLFQNASESAQRAAFESGRPADRRAAADGRQDSPENDSSPVTGLRGERQVPIPPEMDLVAAVPISEVIFGGGEARGEPAGGHIVALHKGHLGLRAQQCGASLGGCDRDMDMAETSLVYLTADGAVGHFLRRPQ